MEYWVAETHISNFIMTYMIKEIRTLHSEEYTEYH